MTCEIFISTSSFSFFFFFNDTATTEIYTLSLHDALPILSWRSMRYCSNRSCSISWTRSEEHTSELQSRRELVCRLLLEKKKNKIYILLIPKTKNNIIYLYNRFLNI